MTIVTMSFEPIRRVAFAPEQAIVGWQVTPPPWGVEDGLPHVVWDGDEYLCVLPQQELVGAP